MWHARRRTHRRTLSRQLTLRQGRSSAGTFVGRAPSRFCSRYHRTRSFRNREMLRASYYGWVTVGQAVAGDAEGVLWLDLSIPVMPCVVESEE